MTKRILALVGMVASGLACDDPEVAGKAADLLEYGMVEAQISCVLPYTTGTNCGNNAVIKATRFADGSSFISCQITPHVSWQISAFNERGATASVSLPHQDAVFTCSVDGGNVALVQTVNSTCSRVVDIDTYCTGRNLEAFE